LIEVLKDFANWFLFSTSSLLSILVVYSFCCWVGGLPRPTVFITKVHSLLIWNHPRIKEKENGVWWLLSQFYCGAYKMQYMRNLISIPIISSKKSRINIRSISRSFMWIPPLYGKKVLRVSVGDAPLPFEVIIICNSLWLVPSRIWHVVL
jgi:hypothetical protein